MAGRRRGARSGRGWDAAPPRAASTRKDKDSSKSTGDASPASGADESELAREICLRQLAVRPRTRAELATALTRRGISESAAEEVLARYDEVGLIDDAAFARAWVSSRHQGRGLARRALASELRQRGVDAETAGLALDDLDPETEAATARSLVDRKLRTATGPPDAVFRRLVGMLARKGYPAGVAIKAVKDAIAERSAATEAAEYADFVAQLDADALTDAAMAEADPEDATGGQH